MKYDLLKDIEYGGCSAKIPAKQLEQILSGLPIMTHPNLLVDISTHDDAGVYRLNDDTALIFTTDFFPPICSDAYEFGQIAAANALSDVYAMGGKPLMALNIITFSPSKLPLEVYAEILRGGHDMAIQAGCLIVGGHTIDDHPPKYGLAVVGLVHPEKVLTNAGANTGDVLILTKPIGSGLIMAAKKMNLCSDETLHTALDNMKILNKEAIEIAQKFDIHSVTDITGFSLAGHSLKMATASKKTIKLFVKQIPLLPEVYKIADMGCIPGAVFRNMEFTESDINSNIIDYNLYVICHDAQTSGGLLISVNKNDSEQLLIELKKSENCQNSEIIGEVCDFEKVSLELL
jgi:selenide,water dikinase